MLYVVFLVVTLHVEVCAWYHLCCMLPAFSACIHQSGISAMTQCCCMLPTFPMYIHRKFGKDRSGNAVCYPHFACTYTWVYVTSIFPIL